MAGFFGIGDYTKEGPGIEKNAPKKKTFFVFFETFFRNFWKFTGINAVYSILSMLIITGGLANAGFTHVARNTARDKHSFGLSDFFETIKKNWKQALAVGIINILVFAITGLGVAFYGFVLKQTVFTTIGLGICFAVIFCFLIMNFYIWTLMITFNFSLKQLFVNSFKFVFINMKNNLLCGLCLLLVYAFYVCFYFIFPREYYLIFTLEFLIYFISFPGFRFLLIQYFTFPAIKKYIIDPYYNEHPDADIQLRLDLGLEIEEEKPEAEEDTEEEFDETDTDEETENTEQENDG